MGRTPKKSTVDKTAAKPRKRSESKKKKEIKDKVLAKEKKVVAPKTGGASKKSKELKEQTVALHKSTANNNLNFQTKKTTTLSKFVDLGRKPKNSAIKRKSKVVKIEPKPKKLKREIISPIVTKKRTQVVVIKPTVVSPSIPVNNFERVLEQRFKKFDQRPAKPYLFNSNRLKKLAASLGRFSGALDTRARYNLVKTWASGFFPLMMSYQSYKLGPNAFGKGLTFSGVERAFFYSLNKRILSLLRYKMWRDLPHIINTGDAPINIEPRAMKHMYFTSQMYAKFVTRRLKQRFSLFDTFKVLRGFLRGPWLSGYLLRCSGRFSKKQRASTYVFRKGCVPISQFNTPVEYYSDLVRLRYGTCCIKVWLNRKITRVGKNGLL